MKALVTLLALVPFLSLAQNNSSNTLNYLIWGPEFIIGNSMSYDYYAGVNRRNELIKEHKVNTVKAYELKNNGSKKVTSERVYNADGLPIKEVNKYATTEYSYSGTLLTDVNRKAKRKVIKTHADYDAEGRIVHITKNVNGKLRTEYKYVYYSGHQTSLVEQVNYGLQTKVYKYVTEYDDVLKKPTRSRYFVNGVLKRNWTYSCDDKGEVQQKNVKEVSSCSYDAKNNDGSYIQYTRTITDGKVYLNENTFSKDSVLLDSKRYYNEKTLVYHYWIDGNTSTSENFNDNGKRIYKYSNTTDGNGNRIAWKSYGRKDQVKFGYDCKFSEKNLVEKVQYLSDKYSINFEYTFY